MEVLDLIILTFAFISLIGAVLAVLAAFLPPAWQITKSQWNKRSKEKYDEEIDAESCTHL